MRFLTGKLFVLGVLGAALLMFPVDSLRALGLGEARVDSYLGQTLDVSVRLIEADAAALDSLTVAHATPGDYERLGVPAGATALGLEVTVDRRVNPPVLRIRSQRPVSDPVIQFLVDARWSSGRVLREYTLFLDPPTLDVAPPVRRDDIAQTRAEPAQIAEPRPESAPTVEPDPVPSRPAPAPAPAPASEGQAEPERVVTADQQRAAQSTPGVIGPIAAGQTLWSIADAWRPDTSLTMNQVMLAILDRNPQAFIDGNVNRLMRGAELTMPSEGELGALGVAEADRRMATQMQAWEQGSRARGVPIVAEAAVPEVERTRQTPARPAETEMVHRLEVVPPESDVFDDGPAVSDGEVERASNRLSDLEDQMYSEALDNNELMQHIGSIREAIRTREAAGLAVADEELAIFEARLREARADREESERLLAELESAATDDEFSAYFRELEDELAGTDSGVDGVAGELDAVAEVGLEAGAAVEAEAEEAAPVAVAALEDARTESGGLPVWLWLIVAIVVIGVIAGGFVFVRRRRDSGAVAAGSGRFNVEAQRERVAANPNNLAAHLALLKALVPRDDPEAFSDALDNMYRRVDNDDNKHWQEALNLAVTQAPDHPLLTPNETALDDGDDGLDDRTREMLGILGAGSEQESVVESPDDYKIDSDLQPGDEIDDDDEFFGTEADESDESDEVDKSDKSDEQAPTGRMAEWSDSTDIDADLDLAQLSNRIDDPTEEQPVEASVESEEDVLLDLDADSELELEAFGNDIASEEAVREDSPTAAEDSDEPEVDALDLDFNFTQGQNSQPAGAPAAVDPDELAFDVAGVTPEADELDEADDLDGRGDRELEAFLGHDAGLDDQDEPDEEPGDFVTETDERLDVAADDGDHELSDEDAEVKLDLARAYLSMDDPDSARALLEEITSGGSASMRAQAHKLVDSL